MPHKQNNRKDIYYLDTPNLFRYKVHCHRLACS